MTTPEQHGNNTADLASLTLETMAARVRMLASQGYGDHEIARLMGLHVRYVRQLLRGEHD